MQQLCSRQVSPYATDQIIDLIANGVEHVHIYSMNKPKVAEGIMKNLSEIIK